MTKQKQSKDLTTAEIKEYRVTRPEAYAQNTPGFNNPSARQGYYVKAISAHEAACIIRERLGYEEPMHVQCWDGSCDHGLTILLETR